MKKDSTEEMRVVYKRSELERVPDNTDWERVNAITDSELEADDPLTDEELDAFEMVIYADDGREIKLDVIQPEILKWFEQSSGKDYKQKINAVLRTFIEAQPGTQDT